MGMPGPLELIIILVIVVLVFGGKRLKNLGGDLGGAIKGFKKSMKDVSAEETTEKAEDIIEVKTEKEEETSK
jgi:sec-independent protein translocase protein TatA